MKFGKSLSIQIEETLPEWRDKFLSYKELKKRLKLIEPKPQAEGDDSEERPEKRQRTEDDGMTEEEADFVRLLEDELEKFNGFFVEKEEEYIIRLKELQDRLAMAKDSKDVMINIRKEIVDFHGEMVLLENYSALNYTGEILESCSFVTSGLVKILKKYDKRTGALLRLPFIQKVLQQPFFTTDLLFKLVKECERLLEQTFPEKDSASPAAVATNGKEPATSSVSKELADIEYMKNLYMKSTLAALRVLKEIRSGSSTVSAFSLPPLQIGGLEETWKKISVMEQVAK